MIQQQNLIPNNASYRLFKYAVIIADTDGNLYVKDGDHRCDSIKEAKKYAADETIGKGRGLIQEKDLLGVWDMTDHAIGIDPMYDPTIQGENYRRGYDDAIRGMAPLPKKFIKNFMGGSSLELHPIPKEMQNQPDWRERLRIEWDQWHNALQNGKIIGPAKIYDARQFTNDFHTHIIQKHKKKGLLGGFPGSGKETASLALIQLIHTEHKFSSRMINLFTATIPDTLCEPINELSEVKGMNVNGTFVDFENFKVYAISKWYKDNKDNLTMKGRMWAEKNITFIDTAEDLPKEHHDCIPMLIAGYHHIAYQVGSKGLRKEYQALQGRIGTMVIGEAHKFLDKDNKMWKIVSSIGYQFLMAVTGTPYNLIFNESSNLNFGPDERSIFSRQQMITEKNNDPASPFASMPDILYYQVGVDDIIERMKQDPKWMDDADGMTWKKLFVYDNEKKVFKYFDQIDWFVRRLCGIPEFDSPDALAIKNLPKLCDKAKNNIIFYCPQGTKESGVNDYIPELVRQLQSSGALGRYKGLIANQEDVSSLKEEINSGNPTAMFTCFAKATGTNIPPWGMSILLRPIGGSLNFIEQGPEGRIGRASEGKTNCGVMLGEPYNIASLKIQVEEKLTAERGEDVSTIDIIDNHLSCHYYFSNTNGGWQSIDKPNFYNILEDLNAKGNYNVNLCIQTNGAPINGFDLEFDEHNTTGTSIEMGSDANKGARNKTREKIQQMQFNFKDPNKLDDWIRMKKKHLSIIRIIAWSNGFDTLRQVADFVDKAIINDDQEVIKCLGKGYEFIPYYLLDPSQIDQVMANNFISKMIKLNDPTTFFDILDNDAYAYDVSDGDYNTDLKIAQKMVEQISDKDWLSEKIIYEPDCKKGHIIFQIIKKLKSLGIPDHKIRERIYFGDRNQLNVNIVKRLFDLPNGWQYNITDVANDRENLIAMMDEKIEQKLQGCIVLMNPPYLKRKWFKILKSIKQQVNPSQIVTVNPDPTDNNSDMGNEWKEFLLENGIQSRFEATDYFNVESGKISVFHLDTSLPGNPDAVKIEKSVLSDLLDKVLLDAPNSYIWRGDQGLSYKSDLSDTKSQSHCEQVINSVGKEDFVVKYAKISDCPTSSKHKIKSKGKFFIFNRHFGKNNPDPVYQINIEDYWLGYNVMAMESNDNETVENFLSVYGSKLYRKILEVLRNGGFDVNQSTLMKLPKLDLTKKWSDAELYDHFGLSQEIIDFVEH